jgi:hypothetical protein
VIDVFDHASSVHTLVKLFFSGAASPTAHSGILVRVEDEEGGNVDSITAHRQRNSITKSITSLMHDSVAPML